MTQKWPKNALKWSGMGFYDFSWLESKKGQKLTKKPKNPKFDPIMARFEPKMPIFSKMASFRDRGQKYSKTGFFAPNLCQKPFLMVFGHF